MSKNEIKKRLIKILQSATNEWEITNLLLFHDITNAMTEELFQEAKEAAIKNNETIIICLCRREYVGIFLPRFIYVRADKIAEWLTSNKEEISFVYDGAARGGMAFFPDGHAEYTSRLIIKLRKDPENVFGFYICNIESEINPDCRVVVENDELIDDYIELDDVD